MRVPLPLIFALLLIHFMPTTSWAQSTAEPLTSGYYIVVAAYKLGQENYAQNYVNRISKSEAKASYGADINRKFIYVYLDYYTDYDQSIQEMLASRKKNGFEQAWVRIMKGSPEVVDQVAAVSLPIPVVNKVEEKTVISSSPVEEEAKKVEEAQGEVEVKSEPVEVTMEDSEVSPAEVVTEPQRVADASVYVSLFNARNNEPIEGDVEIVDTERARLITKIKGNEYVKFPDPKSKSGRITLLTNVFGYRPLQHEINYEQIPADTMQHFIEWAGNHYIVKFDLVRYHKGDINTLYNVFFYNDAAIMLPESRYQLNSLLTMMKENPNYKIMLHGHTNGNSRGRIITMGPSKSFFALADDVKEGIGSAKQLSSERAEVIREWLISEGIAATRIQVKAWGGGRMLHDKNSVNAKKNVRVDVEILEE